MRWLGIKRDVAALAFTARVVLLIGLVWPVFADQPPDLLLAKQYQAGEINLSEYWVSEKYDGVRAYWDGERLLSRQGNEISAPAWFIANYPVQPLDGELWIGRGQFEATLSAVSKAVPVDAEWRQLKHLIFELPGAEGSFSARIEEIQRLIEKANLPHLQAVKQFRIENSAEALQNALDVVLENGGEGLMLHRADARYHGGRSDDLLKVKPYQDAEAIVLAHLPGKGKYAGLLGALLVETPAGVKFRIGSGFSDAERAKPPPLGSTITYKYFGKTGKGVPRFASFLRIYHGEKAPVLP